jgi:hypothetical protein
MSTPLFSKRHYEWIAAFCREHLTGMDCVTLAEALQRDNPAFKRGKFMDACDFTSKLDPEAQRVVGYKQRPS